MLLQHKLELLPTSSDAIPWLLTRQNFKTGSMEKAIILRHKIQEMQDDAGSSK